jgi:hypothetical protein
VQTELERGRWFEITNIFTRLNSYSKQFFDETYLVVNISRERYLLCWNKSDRIILLMKFNLQPFLLLRIFETAIVIAKQSHIQPPNYCNNFTNVYFNNTDCQHCVSSGCTWCFAREAPPNKPLAFDYCFDAFRDTCDGTPTDSNAPASHICETPRFPLLTVLLAILIPLVVLSFLAFYYREYLKRICVRPNRARIYADGETLPSAQVYIYQAQSQNQNQQFSSIPNEDNFGMEESRIEISKCLTSYSLLYIYIYV